MGRSFALLDLPLADSLNYDAARNILFINFQGYAIHSMEEVDSVRRVVDAMCAGIGRKVALVANYNGFRIDEALSDAYFAMVEELHARHYSQATRYATSAFMRAKLGGALSTRQATAAVFESRGEGMGDKASGRLGPKADLGARYLRSPGDIAKPLCRTPAMRAKGRP